MPGNSSGHQQANLGKITKGTSSNIKSKEKGYNKNIENSILVEGGSGDPELWPSLHFGQRIDVNVVSVFGGWVRCCEAVFSSPFSVPVHWGHAHLPHSGPAGGGVAKLCSGGQYMDCGVGPRLGLKALRHFLGVCVSYQELDNPAR